MTTDRYGLPQGILGPLPDDFFACLGRVVCISAVIELQVEALHMQLAQVSLQEVVKAPATTHVRECRRRVGELQPYARPLVMDYLDDVDRFLLERNALIHSAYPRVSDGQVWGHRTSRAKLDGSADPIDAGVPQLVALIRDMSARARQFSSVIALCGNRGF